VGVGVVIAGTVLLCMTAVLLPACGMRWKPGVAVPAAIACAIAAQIAMVLASMHRCLVGDPHTLPRWALTAAVVLVWFVRVPWLRGRELRHEELFRLGFVCFAIALGVTTNRAFMSVVHEDEGEVQWIGTEGELLSLDADARERMRIMSELCLPEIPPDQTRFCEQPIRSYDRVETWHTAFTGLERIRFSERHLVRVDSGTIEWVENPVAD